jgi:hypothetical protein
LAKTAAYDDMVFDWYQQNKVPVTAILASGMPEDKRAAQAFLRHAMAKGGLLDATKTWDWVAAHAYADDPLAREYVDFLFNKERYPMAAQAWASYQGDRSREYLHSNWVFNGDFESVPSGSSLDWKFDKTAGVKVALDDAVAHSGSHSLRIAFEGTGNVTEGYLAETVVVPPGNYHFEAYVKTQNVTTDQGVSLRVLDPDSTSRLDGRTDPLLGTSDWKRLSLDFCVSPRTKRLEIRVARKASLKFDSKIKGTVWVDTVRLWKVGEACSGSAVLQASK